MEYTPSFTDSEGFLLLTIANATLVSISPQHDLDGLLNGLTSLECVTVSVADPLERDVWLVMRVEPSSKIGESIAIRVPVAGYTEDYTFLAE